MSNKKNKILITSSSNKIPLIKNVNEAIRKLKIDLSIIASDIDINSISKYFVNDFWLCERTEEINIHDYIKKCKSKNIKFIIPTRDGELEFFSKNNNLFNKNGIHVMISSLNSINNCIDKLKFYDNHQKVKKWIIKTTDNINTLNCKKFVVKERYGSASKKNGINFDKINSIKHAKKLDNPIFQPYIEGFEISADFYVDKSKIIRGLVMRTRDVVIDGESKVTKTFKNTKYEKIILKIIDELKLYGHCMIQCIIDINDNVNVIECNPRFGGASSLSVFCGLDSFHWFIYESLNGNMNDLKIDLNKKEVQQVRYKNDIYL